eukprot:15467789-Alexandrium_andersonii.AAC.1
MPLPALARQSVPGTTEPRPAAVVTENAGMLSSSRASKYCPLSGLSPGALEPSDPRHRPGSFIGSSPLDPSFEKFKIETRIAPQACPRSRTDFASS